MFHRFLTIVGYQILLAYISDIAGFALFSEKMIKRLLLVGAQFRRNRFIPLLAVGEDWTNVENHAAQSEHAMLHPTAPTEASMGDGRRGNAYSKSMTVRSHNSNIGFSYP